MNRRFGIVAAWLVLLSCVVSAGNAFSRYTISRSSNAWLEIQWYMFGAMVMLGASYTLKVNEHVRVDLVYGNAGYKGQLWIDLLGAIFFLLPGVVFLCWLSWPIFYNSLLIGEYSTNAGGLLRWPIKLCVPLGFLLLIFQALSEIVKRVAAMRGYEVDLPQYKKPEQ